MSRKVCVLHNRPDDLANTNRRSSGDAQMMYLPKLGIKGNSHMLMQDRNSLDLADLLLAWIDNHVESKPKASGKR